MPASEEDEEKGPSPPLAGVPLHEQRPRMMRHRTTTLNHAGLAADHPPRHELVLLGEGESKVTMVHETRVPNATVFTFNKEDHTLGNLLRAQLLKSPNVLFSAYKTPHPLFASIELRVQTDGTISPKDAVIKACADIVQDLQRLDQEFTKEFELKKIAQGQGEGV